MVRTARLTLRPPVAGDLDALHAIYSDPVAMRYWSSPPHETRAQTDELLQGHMRTERDFGPEWVIELDGTVIGRIGLWSKWEFGYLLHPDHWGRGLATEAVRAFLPCAFARHPGMEVLTADIDPVNIGSARVLEKAGFRVTGHARNTYCINGHWSDSTYYALGRDDCPAPRT